MSLLGTADASATYDSILVSELSPTQSSVGALAVKEKFEKMKKMSAGELDRYLKTKVVPVVLGPEGHHYMLDRHHTSLAMIYLKGNEARVYYRIAENQSALPLDAFWKMMSEKKFALLQDEQGLPIQAKDIPHGLQALKDDPYRSLAYYVRVKGGFKKSKQPFAEFLWANYFRTRVTLKKEKDPKGFWTLRKAVRLARIPEAKDLPGYIGKP